MIPELTASVGVPRLAGVEHPFGLPFGLPGDVATQTEVLRGALAALVSLSQPGEASDLPFEWNPTEKVITAPPAAPPITSHLLRHPWQLPKFFNRTPPDPE